MATSIRESAKAMAATEGSVEWQIRKYAIYHESPSGPKKSLRTGNWAELANHIQTVRLVLDKFWRSPLPLDCVQRNAARIMIFIVALTQKTWFDSISEDHDRRIVNFVPADNALELRRRISETGNSRRESDRRSVPLCDPTRLLSDSDRVEYLKLTKTRAIQTRQCRSFVTTPNGLVAWTCMLAFQTRKATRSRSMVMVCHLARGSTHSV